MFASPLGGQTIKIQFHTKPRGYIIFKAIVYRWQTEALFEKGTFGVVNSGD